MIRFDLYQLCGRQLKVITSRKYGKVQQCLPAYIALVIRQRLSSKCVNDRTWAVGIGDKDSLKLIATHVHLWLTGLNTTPPSSWPHRLRNTQKGSLEAAVWVLGGPQPFPPRWPYGNMLLCTEIVLREWPWRPYASTLNSKHWLHAYGRVNSVRGSNSSLDNSSAHHRDLSGFHHELLRWLPVFSLAH